jgi:hypothetical protein
MNIDEMLGPDLSAEVTWHATDAPLVGPLADLLRAGQWDINKMAHYLPVYESAFGDRDRPVRMLEIGVNFGGSLELWRKYFTHPGSVVVGIDYNEKCTQFDNPEHNMYVRIGKQQDQEFLRGVVEEFGPFDIVLDDASHIPAFTLQSFRYLFLHGLNDDGVYLVEDLHSCYSPDSSEPFPDKSWFQGANDGSPQFIHFVMQLMDIMHAHWLQTPTGDDIDKFEPSNPTYQESFQVPLVTTIIKGIELYDAIVAIRRGHPELPRMIRRWSRERMEVFHPPRDVSDFLDHRHPFLGESDRTRRDWI